MSQNKGDRTSSEAFKRTIRWLRKLSAYHQYRVIDPANSLHAKGALLFACNHSLATYDAVLLALAGYDAQDRWFHAMAERLFFRVPGLRDFAKTMGFVEGTRERALSLLKDGEVLGILPGGMRESIRGSSQKYKIDWRDRHGFVWLSLLSGAPIVLAACPRADDIFDVAETPLTNFIYERFRLPFPIFRGRGLTPIPKPVKLWHLLSEPISASVAPDRVTKHDVMAHHAMLTKRMNVLMEESLHWHSDAHSRGRRERTMEVNE